VEEVEEGGGPSVNCWRRGSDEKHESSAPPAWKTDAEQGSPPQSTWRSDASPDEDRHALKDGCRGSMEVALPRICVTNGRGRRRRLSMGW
jgi:hypothetical protein